MSSKLTVHHPSLTCFYFIGIKFSLVTIVLRNYLLNYVFPQHVLVRETHFKQKLRSKQQANQYIILFRFLNCQITYENYGKRFNLLVRVDYY